MSTRAQLRDLIGYEFGMFQSVCGVGETALIVDDALYPFATHHWQGCECYIRSSPTANTPQGEARLIADSTRVTAPARGTLTLAVDLTGLPDACTYQIWRFVSVAGANRALAQAGAGALITTNLAPDPGTLDYPLVGAVGLSRPQQIVGVWYRPADQVTKRPIRLNNYEVEDGEGVLVLRLPIQLQADDGLWLTYAADETYLTSDERSVNLPDQLVLARAMVLLLQALLPSRDEAEGQRWGTLLRYWQETRLREEQMLQPATGRVHGTGWA